MVFELGFATNAQWGSSGLSSRGLQRYQASVSSFLLRWGSQHEYEVHDSDGVIWLGILRVISYEKLFQQLSAIRKPVKILLRHAFLWTSKIISRQFVIL